MKSASPVLLLAGLLAFFVSPAVGQSFLPLDDPGTDGLVSDAALAGFGGAVAVSDGQVLVGEGRTSIRSGSVFIYERGADGTWSQTARVTAPDGEPGDSFGRTLAVSGNLMVVGAPTSGRAFLYTRSGGEWDFVSELIPSGDVEGAGFGAAVHVMDGWAVVGAPGSDEGRGAVHLFRDADGSWSEVSRIRAPDDAPESGFGNAVGIRDGEIFVGAPLHQGRTGAVFAYRQNGNDWEEAGTLMLRGEPENAVFGARIVFDGDRIAVGAPNLNNVGAVVFFSADDAREGWIERRRLQSFDGATGSGFGGTLAASDEAIWVGVPQGNGQRGAVDRILREDDRFTGVERISGSWTEPRDGFGSALAISNDVAVIAAGGADNNAGAVVIFERDAEGNWVEAETVQSEPEAFPAIVAESVMCENGTAAGFDCSNIEILSFLPLPDIGGGRGIRLNDTWGWTDEETGREVVLVGRTDGTAFVDITDPVNPVYLGEILRTEGSPTAAWRDFKVFRDHAFIVADASGAHGMQVFDLRRLDEYDGEPITWEPDLTYDRINSAHNIGLNAESGHVYIVGASGGGETCGGGLHMVDVNDPMNPQFAGCFADPQTGRTGTGYSHDVQCVTYRGPDERYFEREICMGSNETHLSVADVTDKENPVAVSRVAYPNVGYVHQGWFDEDHRYFYMQDELALMSGLIDNTRTIIFDVSDLEDPQVVNEFFFDSRAVSHNLYIVGDLMYEANYSSGLRIVDISDRENPEEVGYIDTAPTHAQEPMFEGAWSTYPFFESGAISVSSIGEGLFIVRFHDSRPVS